jgi:hypothetical protein
LSSPSNALESATLRAKKPTAKANAPDLAVIFSATAMDVIECSARAVLAACSEGDALHLAVLRRFLR